MMNSRYPIPLLKIKRLLLFIALPPLFIFSHSLPAGYPKNDNLSISYNPSSDVFEISWDGVIGRTYFIQYELDQLLDWAYLPLIEQGDGTEIGWGMNLAGTADRAFFRLRYTDVPTPDPYLADFGGDGIPAGWKLESGLDPFEDYTGLAPTGSSLTYWELWQLSLEGAEDPVEANVAGLVVYSP